MTTDEWVLVTPEAGPVAREQFLGAIESGALVHDEMTSSSERVHVYGDGATLVCRVQNHGSYLGAPFTYDEWSTDTYVRGEDGRWRCVVTALTPVVASQAC